MLRKRLTRNHRFLGHGPLLQKAWAPTAGAVVAGPVSVDRLANLCCSPAS